MVLLLLILIGLNVSWARKQDAGQTKKRGKDDSHHTSAPRTRRGGDEREDKLEVEVPSETHKSVPEPAQASADGFVGGHSDVPNGDTTNLHTDYGVRRAESRGDSTAATAHQGQDPRLEQHRATQTEEPLEVLERSSHTATPVFSKANYHLNSVTVPEFEDDGWRRSFEFLSKNDSVLGWIAFSGDTVGAADQKYEEDFLEALRGYRHSTHRLQKHVGLSHILETSIIGDEGKVWFLTVVDDSWFALFVERSVNSAELTKQLLLTYQTDERDPDSSR